MTVFFAETALGRIGIAEQNGKIRRVYLANDKTMPDLEIAETALLMDAFAQLQAYLAGELQQFYLPLAPEGTEFMRQVWKALCAVPYGRTASYKDIAVAVQNPNAVRAVGMANHRNPLPIFIPCHRIIGSTGKLVGYGGGLQIKQHLLDLEKRYAVF